MSNELQTKIEAIKYNVDDVIDHLKEVKQSIAAALRFNGITNVTDDETFVRYAELIRRLKFTDTMIFEFTIPETAKTDYKRTVMLPMEFTLEKTGEILGQTSHAAVVNAIAKEILANDTKTYSIVAPIQMVKAEESHFITDMYGNEISDGNYTPPFTMDDIQEYLSEEEQTEFLTTAQKIGVAIPLSDDSNGEFEYDVNATYCFTVDWGDGSDECLFDLRNGRTFDDNRSAVYHTYEEPGVYQVGITGVFKRMQTGTTNQPSEFVDNNAIVYDKDNKAILNGNNYAMYNHLTSVIAWGNTMLTDMTRAFECCRKLEYIPMYDTKNSFADVTTFADAFLWCSSLKTLPYNPVIDKGLFSGCEKVKSFARCFLGCSGLKGEIPPKFIDGCKSVTTVESMFDSCYFTGTIPLGFFDGLESLTTATSTFAGCKFNGEVPSDLFKNNPKVTKIGNIFNSCKGLSGRITKNFIGNLPNLIDMHSAFRGCEGITSIDSDAFFNLKNKNIDFSQAFQNSGITEIPKGLLESLTGENLLCTEMFNSCKNLVVIDSDALTKIKVSNARGMFGNCPLLTCNLPNSNPDWETLDGIARWYGCFAMCPLNDIEDVCVELGGYGERKFKESKVGMIAFSDGSFLDFTEYTHNEEGVEPIGVIYADVYIDPEISTPFIKNSAGNVVDRNTEGAVHKIYGTVFNDVNKPWINGIQYVEAMEGITSTSDASVGYNKYTWTNGVATLNPTRYNGEAYTEAWYEWIGENGGAKFKDRYDVLHYLESYKLASDGIEISDKIKKFAPDGADMWDQGMMKYLIQQVIDKVIEVNADKTSGTTASNGTNSGNCYSLRSNYYLCSGYGNKTIWGHYAGNAFLWSGFGLSQTSMYFRPSFVVND